MNIMSKTDTVQYAPQVALHTQWKVITGRTYNIICNHTISDENIAIRTIAGKGRIALIDHSEYVLNKDTFFITTKSKIKHYYCDADCWSFHWFEFSVDLMISQYMNRVYMIIVSDRETQDMDQSFNFLGLGTKYFSQKASAVFSVIFTDWLECINTVEKHNPFDGVVFEAIKNLTDNSSVKEMAYKSNMSERSFRDLFYKYTGLSPKKYIEKRKLDSAKELILTTQLQIKEIAGKLGYSNQYYFSRVFTKKYGNPPSYYKNKKMT